MTHDLPVKHHTERINTAGKHSQSVNLQCIIEFWHTESNRAPVHPFFPAGLAVSSPLQPSLGRSGTSPAFNPSRSSSPQAKGGASTPSPHKQLAQGHHHHHHSGHGAVRKGKGPGGPGARWCTHTHECALTHMHAQLSRHRTHTHAEKLTYSHCDPDRRPLRLAQQLIGPPSLTHTHTHSHLKVQPPPHQPPHYLFHILVLRVLVGAQNLPWVCSVCVVTRVFSKCFFREDKLYFSTRDRKLFWFTT